MSDLREDLDNLSWIEVRYDRPYDEQSESGLVHPNGTKIASFDRAFLGAAAVLVIEAHLEWCPANGAEGHTFIEHDESPAGPRRVTYCSECQAQPRKDVA